MRVGFLTYDLQRNTEDALFEVARAAPQCAVKAFPLYRHDDQALSRVDYRPATGRGKHRGQCQGQHAGRACLNPEWAVGLACARQSDVIVLKGLLGPGAIWCAVCARLLRRAVISTNQTLPRAGKRSGAGGSGWRSGYCFACASITSIKTLPRSKFSQRSTGARPAD